MKKSLGDIVTEDEIAPRLEGTFDSRDVLGGPTKWIALVGGLGIMFLAAAVLTDVTLRYLFNFPILGVDDLGQYNLAVIVTSFFPVCLVGGHFVTIRFLGRALGTRGGLWLEVLGNTGTLFIFLLFGWQFLRFTYYDVTLTGLATVVLEVPQAAWWWVVTAIIWLCIPIQAVVLYECILRAIRCEPRRVIDEGEIGA